MGIFDETRFKSRDKYVEYQELIVTHHLLPLFKKLKVPLDKPILDVGCGSGGGTIALAKTLKVPITGVDIRADDIGVAKNASKDYDLEVKFEVLDIINDKIPKGNFGIIIMHDVVEHLPDLRTALKKLYSTVDLRSVLYVSFPPWRGPYAGHQHRCYCSVRYMPYLHAIAPSLFLKLLHRWEKIREKSWLLDVTQIVENKLSMKKFEMLARSTGWSIRYRKSYLLRPEYMRMGMPKISNGWIGQLPIIGEIFSSGCEYLLTPTNKQYD